MCPYSRPEDAGTFGCARLDPRIDADTVRCTRILTQMTRAHSDVHAKTLELTRTKSDVSDLSPK